MSTCLLTDKKGFLWIGTLDGLNRFDGMDFKQFHHNPDDIENTLPSNKVSALLQDSKGLIWIGTYSGLAYFNPKNAKFHVVSRLKFKDSNIIVYDLFEDIYNTIWVGTNRGLYHLRYFNDDSTSSTLANSIKIQQISYPDIPGLNSYSRVNSILGDNGYYIYLGTDFGLFKYPLQSKGSGKPPIQKIHNYSTHHMAWDRNGGLWHGNKKLFQYHPSSEKTLEINVPGISSFTLMSAAKSNENDLYFGLKLQHNTNDKINKFIKIDPSTKEVTELEGLDDIYPIALEFTNNSLIWVGTAGYGLKKVDLNSQHFQVQSIRHQLEQVRNQKSGFNSFSLQGQPLFINCRNRQLTVRNALTGKIISPEDIDSNTIHSKLPGVYNSHFPTSALIDMQGHIWIPDFYSSNNESFIHHFNDQFQWVEAIPISKDIKETTLAYRSSKNEIWFGATRNLLRIDASTSKVKYFSFPDSTPGMWIINLALDDPTGSMWLASTGYYLYSFDTDHKSGNQVSVRKFYFGKNILSILNDPIYPNKFLWVGTDGGGLARLNKKTGIIKWYGIEEGIPSLVVYGILPDHRGYMWLSTNKGLVEFHPKQGVTRHFEKSDGLPTNEFNRFLYTKLNDGRLCFESLKGMVMFHPENLKLDTVSPPISFTKIHVLNRPLDLVQDSAAIQSDIPYCQSITLPYDKNIVSFQYSALDFRASNKNQYMTMLEGLDDSWTKPSNFRTTTYANLAPGNYTFKVQASNAHGVWNREGVAVDLIINAPWWRTQPAYAAYCSFFVLIVFALYKFRMRRLKLQSRFNQAHEQAQRLKAMDKLKKQFFANVTHEFRTPLTLIINPLERLMAKNTQPEVQVEMQRMHRNAHHLLRLINQLLNLNKLDNGSLQPQPALGNLSTFIETNVDLFRSIADASNIQLEMKIDKHQYFAYFDPNFLETIIYNLLSNAIKFTPEGGHVQVQMKVLNIKSKHLLQMDVIDNGPGIKPGLEEKIFERYYTNQFNPNNKLMGGTGIGLSLVRDLTQQLGGLVKVQSKQQEGSKFSISLPITIASAPETTNQDIESNLPFLYEKEERQPEKPSDYPTILVVEDNDELRQFIVSGMSSKYNLVSSKNGLDALEVASEIIPDIVVCDVMMPKLNGFDFIRCLHQEIATSHIPVILLTAKNAQDDRQEGLNSGAIAYITKPFYEAELHGIIENILEHRKRLHDAFKKGFPSTDIIVNHALNDPFLEQFQSIIHSEMDNGELSVDQIAQKIGMSRTQLYRKIKAITGHPVRSFIRKIRLEHARKLLLNGNLTISEAAFKSGFNTHSHFSQCFSDEYGKSPTAYLQQYKAKNRD